MQNVGSKNGPATAPVLPSARTVCIGIRVCVLATPRAPFGLQPTKVACPSLVHWYLMDKDTNAVIDATEGQYDAFDYPPPYDNAKKTDWYSFKKSPIRKTLDLMQKIQPSSIRYITQNPFDDFAITIWLSSCVKIMDLYCVPISPPCLFNVVGS